MSAAIFRAATTAIHSEPSLRRMRISIAGELQCEPRWSRSRVRGAGSAMNVSRLRPSTVLAVRPRTLTNRWFISRIRLSLRLASSTPFSVLSKIAWYFLFSRIRWAVRKETIRATAISRPERIAAVNISLPEGYRNRTTTAK